MALTELPNEEEAIFLSRFNRHLIVRKPHVRVFSELGVPRDLQQPVRYQFDEGVLKVRPGRNQMVDSPGVLAEGEDPDAERDDVEFLMAHPDFNKTFWREGYEPHRPRPVEKDFLADMAKAVAALDIETLEAMREREQSTHARPLLVGAVTAALESTREAHAHVLAQQAVPVAGDGENALEWSEGDKVEDLQATAAEAGVEVKGTGKDGNVLKDDVVRALRRETKKATEKK